MQAISLLHMNIPWYTAGVQQQQINGRGSEQGVNGNCCMHMHNRNKWWGSPYICSKQLSLLQKVGVAHEANVAVAAVVVLPDRTF